MFRIIVISLFVANVFLVGFQVSKPPRKTEVATQSPVAAGDTNIPTIYLFSEMAQDQDLMTGNRQCFTLGPFHDIEDMYAVRNRLEEISLSTNDRQTQALVEKGYWVFLRPYRSLLEANEELFSLQALGLTDIAVVFEGEYKNSISLGYFLRLENALQHKQALEAKGYAPLVRVQRQAEPRYWLDYEQNPGSSLIALDMQSRPNDFMQRNLPCPEQSPPEQSQIAAIATKSEPLKLEPLKSEPPESEPLKSEAPESEPLKSEPSKSEPQESKPSESERLVSEQLELEANAKEPKLLDSELPEPELLNTASLESDLLKSEPLESELLESASSTPDFLITEPQVSELPKTEPQESGQQKFGPPVLEPLESEPPADNKVPIQNDAANEREEPESE